MRSIAVKSTELNIEKGLKIKDFRELRLVRGQTPVHGLLRLMGSWELVYGEK